MPHKQYFAGIYLVMYNHASYVSRTDGVIDDATK